MLPECLLKQSKRNLINLLMRDLIKLFTLYYLLTSQEQKRDINKLKHQTNFETTLDTIVPRVPYIFIITVSET